MTRAAGVRWALLLGVAGLTLWLALRDSTENEVLAPLEVLSAAVQVRPQESPADREARIGQAFERVFVERPRVRIPDLAVRGADRAAVVAAALAATRNLEAATVRFEQPNVTVDPAKREAMVQARAALSARSVEAGFRTDSREVRLRLRKTAAGWKIDDIEAAPPSTVEPEARP